MEIVRKKGARREVFDTLKAFISMAAGEEAASIGKTYTSPRTSVLVSAFASIISGKTLNDLIQEASQVCARAKLKRDTGGEGFPNAEVAHMSTRLTDAIYGAAGRLLSPELNHPSEKPDIKKILHRVLIEHRARMDPEESKQSKQDVFAYVSENDKKSAHSKLLMAGPIVDKNERAARSKRDAAQTQLALGSAVTETTAGSVRNAQPWNAKKKKQVMALTEDEVVIDDADGRTEGSTVTIGTPSPSGTGTLLGDTASTLEGNNPVGGESNDHEVVGVLGTDDSTDAKGNPVVTVTFLVGEDETTKPRDYSFPSGVKLMSAILSNDVAWTQYNECEHDRILSKSMRVGEPPSDESHEQQATAQNPTPTPRSHTDSPPPAKRMKSGNDRSVLLQQLKNAQDALALFDQGQENH